MSQRTVAREQRGARGSLGLLLLFAAMLALVIAALSVDTQSRLAVLLLGIGLMGLTLAVGGPLSAKSPAASFLLRLVLASLAVRLAFFAVIRFTVGPYVFAPDALTYEIVGRDIVRAWSLGLPMPGRATEGLQVGYYLFNGGLFRIFGDAPAAPAIVNAFLGAWVVVPVYLLVLQVVRNNHGVARWASALTAFFPSLILWSVLNIREAPTVLAMALVVYAASRLQDRNDMPALLGVVVGAIVLAISREYLMVLVSGATVAGLLIARGRTPMSSFVAGAALLTLIGLVLQSAGLAENLVLEPSLTRVQAFRTDFTVGAGSAYGLDHDVSTIQGALRFLPTGLGYFLFAPFPWHTRSFLQSVTLPETLMWYALFPFIVRGAYLGIRHDLRRLAVVLSVLVVVTVAYALVEGNVGTAYRHRAQLLPLFFILASVGLRDVYGAWKKRRVPPMAPTSS